MKPTTKQKLKDDGLMRRKTDGAATKRPDDPTRTGAPNAVTGLGYV